MFIQKTTLYQDTRADTFKTIKGVKFTAREIDILACLLSGRSSKTIASFLSISPKTVETHIRSIMSKLECNSRDGIISFIEKSGQFSLIRKRYQDLLIKTDFKKRLKEILSLIRSRKPIKGFLYGNNKPDNKVIYEIEDYLRLVGIDVTFNIGEKSVVDLINKDLYRVIYVGSKPLIEKDCLGNDDLYHLMVKAQENMGFLAFLVGDKGTSDTSQEERTIDYIDDRKYENHYLLFLRLLISIVPDLNLDSITLEFKKYCESIYKSAEFPKIEPKDLGEDKEVTPLMDLVNTKKWILISLTILSISTVSLGVWLFDKIYWIKASYEIQDIIRSNLSIPDKNVLLKRTKLIIQMEEKLKTQQNIQIVVLVGIGGSGKTTLARSYLRSQKSPLIWELNAETKEALVSSFEHLAYAASKTPEEKQEVDSLQKIENSRERARKILLLVKKKLKERPNWCLLFDNVESFSAIKEFFPLDSEAWGKGKIFITTRDSNIKNNNNINPANVITIEELNKKEKFTLLTDIIFENTPQELNSSQRIENFLEKIPSFPLDVSTAAYYIKDTKISYEDYMERLNVSYEDFEKAQETLLKEVSDYTKTRYGVITMTLKNLIDKNQDFKDLLLFICHLDSQDIPKSLLTSYKKSTVVEQFVHDLRKQSLITAETSDANQPLLTFSIHRSIQEIGLNSFKNTLKDYHQTLQDFTKILLTCIKDSLHNYDYPKMKLLARHGEAFLSHRNIVIDKDHINNVLELLIYLGLIYKNLGDYKKTKDLFDRSYHVCKSYFGDNHIKTVEGLANLSVACADVGEYARAKNGYKEVLSKYYKYYGEDHVKTGGLLVNLGNTYKHLGQYSEAKQVYEKGLAIFRKHDPKNYEKICWTLLRLGNIYRILGDYKKAKELSEQSLVIHNNLEDGNDIRGGRILAYLGNIHRNLGDYKKAKDFLEQSLAICRKHYGESNIITHWVLVHLGNTYRCLGFYEKAKDLFEQGLVIHKEYFGETHLETGWVLVHLGNIYRCLGFYEKAKDLLHQVLDVYRSHFGNNHILTGWVLINIGDVYLNMGGGEKARGFFEESLAIYKRSFERDHIIFAKLFLGLGQSYLLTKDIEKAESFLNQALHLFTINNRPDIYVALESLADLNSAKAALEKADGEKSKAFKSQAIDYLKQALEAAKESLPEDSSHLVRLQSKLKADR